MVEGRELYKAEEISKETEEANGNRVCDEGDLELGKDTVPQMTVVNGLKINDSKPITYENYFLLRKRLLLSQRQLKYVEDIIFTRDTENVGMTRKEVIQVISDIRKENYYVQAENHLDYLIQ